MACQVLCLLTHTWQAPLPLGRVRAGHLNLRQLLNAKCLAPPCSPHCCRQSLARPSLGSSRSLVSCSCTYFSSWLSSPSSSRPGSAGRSSFFPEPLKGRWAGLPQASTKVSRLLSDALFPLMHACRAGVTSDRTHQPARCKTGAPSRGCEGCNCNPARFHAMFELDSRQLLEISGTGQLPLGSAPPAPGLHCLLI